MNPKAKLLCSLAFGKPPTHPFHPDYTNAAVSFLTFGFLSNKEPTVESAVVTGPETTAQLREELLSDLKVTTEDILSSAAPDCDTSLGSINLLTDQGKKSVRKTLERNHQFLTNKIISSNIYWGDDDVTQIVWGKLIKT